MTYKSCLEAAGARVIDFAKFGDYQGSWYALVVWRGKTFWVHDYYGSCSGCDPLYATLTYNATQEQMADFGRQYLEDPRDYDQLLRDVLDDNSYDPSADEVVNFLRKYGPSPKGL